MKMKSKSFKALKRAFFIFIHVIRTLIELSNAISAEVQDAIQKVSKKIFAPVSASLILLLFLTLIWKIPEWQVYSNAISDPKDQISLINSNRETLLQAASGLFFFITAYFAWRNISISEEKQLSERFSKAIEHLGSDQVSVRVGGIFSLEKLALDSPKETSNIMEVLMLFINERCAMKKQFLEAEALHVQEQS
jgi:hypothetical protein